MSELFRLIGRAIDEYVDGQIDNAIGEHDLGHMAREIEGLAANVDDLSRRLAEMEEART